MKLICNKQEEGDFSSFGGLHRLDFSCNDNIYIALTAQNREAFVSSRFQRCKSILIRI